MDNDKPQDNEGAKEKLTETATEMTENTHDKNELALHERVSLLNAFTVAISGKENGGTAPENEPEKLVEQMRDIVFETFENNEKQTGKTHLEVLAEKQGKKLEALPTLGLERTSDDELSYLKVLVRNIHEVQNEKSSLGITPNMSLELNCMDCSMSTWTMIHEAKKVGLNVEFGSPIGHAIGIVTTGDGRTFYADGQKGFVEEINIGEETLVNGSKIIEIVNYRDIQDRQVDRRGEKEFFPQFVFVDSQGGVSATMSNLDSMLYKQHTGNITDEERKKYDSGYIEEVETLQPYAKQFKKDVAVIGNNEVYEGEELVIDVLLREPRERMEEIKKALSPDLDQFRKSEQYKKDQDRKSGSRDKY